MKHLKNIILVVATAIILILMTATIVESSKGTAFVRQHIYTSGWFVVLWGIFAIAAAVYIMQRKSNVGASALLVHASFLIILLGALTSWLLAESGTLHLRQGETTSTMKDAEGEMKALGFEVSLNNFNVVNYPGTDAPMDYHCRPLRQDMRAIQQPHHPHQHGGHKLCYQALWQGVVGGAFLKPSVCRMDL